MIPGNDTIAAPATAAGGAIGVVRISGPDALAICDRIFQGRTTLAAAKGYTLHYGQIVDAGRKIDDVLATVFRAPHSYTGEDAVEISCHGSSYILSELLRMLNAAGARMAEPGEFTTRAYLAGKMDLAQAEAVADIIAASSRAAHALASTQMRGGYSQELEALRGKLLHLTSMLELELDFAEEDVEFADRGELRDTMQRIGTQIDSLRNTFSVGSAIKEGVAVAIVGAPNVGKSTLLNRLLGEDRAMVSEIAGTTRDAIEECVNIDGVLFRFIDTAGIRETEDRLEQMGIERTRASIARAQIILRMYGPEGMGLQDGAGAKAGGASLQDGLQDGTAGGSREWLEFTPQADQTVLYVVNKIDTIPGLRLPDEVIGISAKQGTDIDRLRERLRAAVDTTALYHGDAVVSNSRHYEALTAAKAALDRALAGLGEQGEAARDSFTAASESQREGVLEALKAASESQEEGLGNTGDCVPIKREGRALVPPCTGLSTDLLSEEIRQVVHHLGTITGHIASDEVLQHIFSKFCIGK